MSPSSAALAGIQLGDSESTAEEVKEEVCEADDTLPDLISDDEEPARDADPEPEPEPEPEPDLREAPEAAPPPTPPPAASSDCPADEPAEAPVTYPVRPRDLDPANWAVGSVREDGDRHVAPLIAPPLVLLPRTTLELDGRGYATVHLDAREFASFQRAEDWALGLAARSSQDWFGRDIAEDSLRAAFRTCCTSAADGRLALKVEVSDVAAFDAAEAPTDLEDLARGEVEAVLELRRIRFGSTAFGAQWSLLQAQQAPPPRPQRRPIPTRKPLADWVD